MKKKFLITLLFFLASCGYQPLYKNINSNKIVFKEIETAGNKDLNRLFVSRNIFKQDVLNFSLKKLTINSNKNIVATSKNLKGQVEYYKMTINVEITIVDKNEILKTKTFTQEFSYKSLDNKFNLSQYEIDLQSNLANKIIEEFVIYLNL